MEQPNEVFNDFSSGGAGGIEVEPLQEETSEFDVFYFYLKELLDVVDEMEKFQRTDL